MVGALNEVSAREGKCCQVSKNTTINTLSGNDDDVETEKWNREKRERVCAVLCVCVCIGGRSRGDRDVIVVAMIAEYEG